MEQYNRLANGIRTFFDPGPALRVDWRLGLSLDEQHSNQRRAARIAGLLWLFYLAYPIGDIVRGTLGTPQRVAGGIGLTIFIGVYIYAYFHRFYRQAAPIEAWTPVVILALIVTGFTFFVSAPWLGLMIYVVTAAGCSLNQATVIPTTISIAGLTVILGALTGSSFSDVGPLAFEVALIGMTMLFLRRLIATNAELRLAREEKARLAVAEERLRFARDLHDLLGHSLSLIALKSELAGRLVEVNPERAQAEIHDIEQVTREALREVREAVSGYRQPNLHAELTGAQAALDAAGIDCRIDNRVTTPDAPIEAALGWAVREAVTNVIRHSSASICHIDLRKSGESVRLTVRDDGTTTSEPPRSGRAGTGIAGLAERVAALGGTVTAGQPAEGGFRLVVDIPPPNAGANAPAPAIRQPGSGQPFVLGEQP
ncbi:MAG TPA: sensor histidine kinase [Nitrolancea sp.]